MSAGQATESIPAHVKVRLSLCARYLFFTSTLLLTFQLFSVWHCDRLRMTTLTSATNAACYRQRCVAPAASNVHCQTHWRHCFANDFCCVSSFVFVYRGCCRNIKRKCKRCAVWCPPETTTLVVVVVAMTTRRRRARRRRLSTICSRTLRERSPHPLPTNRPSRSLRRVAL